VVKNYKKEQAASLGRYAKIMTGTVLVAMVLISGGQLNAATLEATPDISIKYNYNDNLYANDPEELKTTAANDNEDLVTASYIDYLVGLTLAYRSGRNSFSVNGEAGYEQFVSITGWVEDAKDQARDYNFIALRATVGYNYVDPKFTLSITDTARQTRDLQEVFGEGTDALGYWSLYLNNIATVGVKTQFSTKLKTLFQYSYQSLTFATPENDVTMPADSFENRGYFRSEYSFTGKTQGIVDLQAASSNFGTVNGNKSADYTLLQGMAGIRYIFTPRVNLTVLGGWAQRDFSDLSEQRLSAAWPAPWAGAKLYDLENMSDPVGRVSLVLTSPAKNTLDFTAQQGISTYGQNLFFNYTLYMVNAGYNITPDLRTQVLVQYRQSVYDVEKNGREWLWRDDRQDNTTYVNAMIHWDILKKRNRGTLMLELGGTYQNRDSNIDNARDYSQVYRSTILLGSGVPADSHDAVVTTYYVRLQIVPTLLFGR